MFALFEKTSSRYGSRTIDWQRMDQTRRRDVTLIGLVAIGVRIIFHVVYRPWWVPDSNGYFWWWRLVKDRYWQLYDGMRPPGYPLVFALAEAFSGNHGVERLSPRAAEMTVLFQQLAGVFATILIYLILRNLKMPRQLAFWATAFYALLMPVPFVEMILLPLAPTSSFLIAALWLFSEAVTSAPKKDASCRLAKASGFVFAIGAYMRAELVPFLLAFATVIVVVSFIYRRLEEFATLRYASYRLLSTAVPLIVGIMLFNKVFLGQFTFTTLQPYNATCTVYNIFDRVEDQDKLFGQIMVKYYRGPARIDLINDAWGELVENETKLPMLRRGPLTVLADICAYAGDVSHRLQRRYPKVYLENAVESFTRTFNFQQGSNAPLHHVKDAESVDGKKVMRNTRIFRITEWLRRFEAPVMLLLYCLTLATLPSMIVLHCVAANLVTPGRVILFAVAAAMFATLVAYGFLHTYFPHYGLVFFGVILICGVGMCDLIRCCFRLRYTASNCRAS